MTKRLSDFKLPKINVECWCGRKGRYDRDRAIARMGDIPLPQFFAEIASNCPKWNEDSEQRQCGVGCPDLTYMFSPAPFSARSKDDTNDAGA